MDERLNYSGTGEIVLRENIYPLKLELMLNEGGYYSFIGMSNESILYLKLNYEDILSVELKNITLKNKNNQIIKKLSIKNLFISEVKNNNTTFLLVLRRSFLEMEKEERYNYHYYIYGSVSIRNISLEYKKIVITNNIRQDNLLLIYNKEKKEIKEDELDDIVFALQLLQGHYIKKVSEEFIGYKVFFYVHGKIKKENHTGNSILRDYFYTNNFIFRILNFLDSLNFEEKKKWKRAFQLLISYKNANNVDLLVRLLQFFEIFRSSNRESYRSILENKFNITDCEAIFIKKIRNDLIHEALFLDESIKKNILTLDNKSVLKQYLSKTENTLKQVIIVALYIEEIIVNYIISKLPQSNKYLRFTNNNINTEFKNFKEIYNQILLS